METIVSIFMDKFKWSRRFTCILVAVYSLLIGIPTSLGFGALDFIKPLGMSILDAMDFISNSVLMPDRCRTDLRLRRIRDQAAGHH